MRRFFSTVITFAIIYGPLFSALLAESSLYTIAAAAVWAHIGPTIMTTALKDI